MNLRGIRYNVDYLPEVIKHDIPALPKTAKDRIKKAIETRLQLDPISYGKPMRYSLKGHRRLRVGDYRVIYFIEKLNVTITAIKHRKDVYE